MPTTLTFFLAWGLVREQGRATRRARGLRCIRVSPKGGAGFPSIDMHWQSIEYSTSSCSTQRSQAPRRKAPAKEFGGESDDLRGDGIFDGGMAARRTTRPPAVQCRDRTRLRNAQLRDVLGGCGPAGAADGV